MNRIVIILAYLSFASLTSTCQVKYFDSVANKITFNIFTHNPDSLAKAFVDKCFPAYKKVDSVNYSLIGPKNLLDCCPKKVKHSFSFYRHPFINFQFQEGEIEFIGSEYEGFSPRLTEIRLNFTFKNKADADSALMSLKDAFSEVTNSISTMSNGGLEIVSICDEYREYPKCKVLILIKSKLNNDEYELLYGDIDHLRVGQRRP